MADSERERLEWRSIDVPGCAECGRRWLNPANRWRAYLTADNEHEPNDPVQAVVLCSDCAAREFDEE